MKSWRRGENVYDFTKLEVGAKLLDMLEDPSVIDKQRVTVEFKSAVTEWEEHEAQPSLRGGWYRWTIPERVPCHDHQGQNHSVRRGRVQEHFLLPPHHRGPQHGGHHCQ